MTPPRVSGKQQDATYEELHKAVCELAQCPYPLHDHVSRETWELACRLVAEAKP